MSYEKKDVAQLMQMRRRGGDKVVGDDMHVHCQYSYELGDHIMIGFRDTANPTNVSGNYVLLSGDHIEKTVCAIASAYGNWLVRDEDSPGTAIFVPANVTRQYRAQIGRATAIKFLRNIADKMEREGTETGGTPL